MSKAERYAALVARRKAFDPSLMGLQNPATVDGGIHDSEHVGPWTVWAHDLDAEVMIVGQDWGDVDYFRRNKGFDSPSNPTNRALAKLVDSIGQRLPPPPTPGGGFDPHRATCGIWLTNALPWLKEGGMSAKVTAAWFQGEAALLLKDQIEIVSPKVVLAIGERAYVSILDIFELPRTTGPFRLSVENSNGQALPLGSSATTLFAVYHCGARVQNTIRPMSRQLTDWARIGRALRQ